MLKIDKVLYKNEGQEPLSYEFEFPLGKPIALMGESGAGKTTLFNLIAGFLIPEQGGITWQGQSIKGLSTPKRPVSYLMQTPSLFEHLTAQGNILLSRATLEDVVDIAGRLSLQELLHKKAGELSGGQQQRVALAQTLLQRRSIILLDEPFKGLDEANKKKAIAAIKHFTDFKKQLLIFTTHDSSDIKEIGAQRVSL